MFAARGRASATIDSRGPLLDSALIADHSAPASGEPDRAGSPGALRAQAVQDDAQAGF